MAVLLRLPTVLQYVARNRQIKLYQDRIYKDRVECWTEPPMKRRITSFQYDSAHLHSKHQWQLNGHFMVTQRSSLFVCNFICSLCFSDSALSMKTRIQWCQDFVDKLILKYHVTTHFCRLNIFHLSHFILSSKHKDSNPGWRAEGWRTGWRWSAPTVVSEKEKPGALCHGASDRVT